ncbi:hypothetical protein GF376_01875, partial [Candidatus Peregrinibacteria bacterium]|nr:hypothetical protein [Candidatus Peregrinibacteria bacterium]
MTHPNLSKEMMARPKKKKIFMNVILLIAMAIVAFRLFYFSNHRIEEDNKNSFVTIEDFAICLKEQGMMMYGVDTCEFCLQQKRQFGSAFEQINYINCDFNSQQCQEAEIENYPTWRY